MVCLYIHWKVYPGHIRCKTGACMHTYICVHVNIVCLYMHLKVYPVHTRCKRRTCMHTYIRAYSKRRYIHTLSPNSRNKLTHIDTYNSVGGPGVTASRQTHQTYSRTRRTPPKHRPDISITNRASSVYIHCTGANQQAQSGRKHQKQVNVYAWRRLSRTKLRSAGIQ
jgi:hypothetical protein